MYFVGVLKVWLRHKNSWKGNLQANTYEVVINIPLDVEYKESCPERQHEFDDVVMLICISGVHIKLLRMGPVNMAIWRNWNTFPAAVNIQTVPLRAGFPDNPVCRCEQHREREL